MRKFGIYLLVVMISLGVAVVMGGCGGGGGGGGGDDLPKSLATYNGSNTPAVIDSITAEALFELPWYLDQLFSDINGAAVVFTDYATADGSSSGTASYSFVVDETDTATLYDLKITEKETYDNFVDDGTAWEGVLAGEGSEYYRYEERETYTGVEVVPTGGGNSVGPWVDYSELSHANFNAFRESTAVSDEGSSGWATREFSVENDDDVFPWVVNMDANIAHSDYVADGHEALLGADGMLAWDGSFTTYVGQGTYCSEYGAATDGCIEFDFDFRWDQEGEGAPIPVEVAFPIDGTAEYSTIDASVLFSFGSSPSDSTCFLVQVDVDGDTEYDIEEEICEEI